MRTPLIALQNIRNNYTYSSLNEDEVDSNPIQQFIKWFNEALALKVLEPSAMTLATVSSDGKPSARIVLMKGVDESGFRFYTNYNSHKGVDISKNNQVSLLLFWPELERQVRIEGNAVKLSRKDSEEYFHSRPRASQIGAIVSPQSQEIMNREVLNERNEELEIEWKDKEIPMPEYWGGYLVIPNEIEFWQGGSARLHDRLKYLKKDKDWKIIRLAP